MIMSLVLFENEFLHIVSISFTALILNELIMVALEITTWYASILPTSESHFDFGDIGMSIWSFLRSLHYFSILSVSLFFRLISVSFVIISQFAGVKSGLQIFRSSSHIPLHGKSLPLLLSALYRSTSLN